MRGDRIFCIPWNILSGRKEWGLGSLYLQIHGKAESISNLGCIPHEAHNDMKRKLILGAATGLAMVGSASADFDTAVAWGDATTDAGIDGTGDRGNGRASGTLTVTGTGAAAVYEITSGGSDFWGNNDNGSVIYDSTGAYTTTGDLTATVRHVNVNVDSARTWGRGLLDIRRTQGNPTAGVPERNDIHWGALRRSNAGTQVGTIRRFVETNATRRGTTIGLASQDVNLDGRDNLKFVGREDQNNPVFLSVGRSGNRFYSGYAIDLDGNGNPGRFVVHWGLDGGTTAQGLTATGGNAANPNGTFTTLTGNNAGRENLGIAVGDEVTVLLGHQAHNENTQLEGLDVAGGGRVNTATFDNFSYASSFDGSKFNATSENDTWQVDGTIGVLGDQVKGSAFVRDYINNSGNATGENVKWTFTAVSLSTFTPAFGPAGSFKSANAMLAEDVVPPANFRRSAVLPGLTAEIYTATANGGTSAANLALIAGAAPNGIAIIDNVDWLGNEDSDANYHGLTGPASFGVAVQGVDPASGTAGAFSGDENSYGVDITGEIFIPANGGKIDVIEGVTGDEYIVFKDGVDDFTYLEIDGVEVLNDNNWTNDNSTGNGGGNIALFDCSDPKYDDGEWVSFRMVFWEGGGGDSCHLYWDAFDTNDTFDPSQVPGTYSGSPVSATGIQQVGDESNEETFGLTLDPGDWLLTLDLVNTATSAQKTAVATGVTASSIAERWFIEHFSTETLDFVANPDSDDSNNLLEFGFGIDPNVSGNGVLTVTDGSTLTTGLPTVHIDSSAPNNTEYTARFVRRVDHVAADLTYTVQFSHDMSSWEDDLTVPTTIATQGDHEVVEVQYPYALLTGPNQGRKPRFFRVAVSYNP